MGEVLLYATGHQASLHDHPHVDATEASPVTLCNGFTEVEPEPELALAQLL